MSEYKFYRIIRGKGGVDFVEAGTARYVGGRVVVETADSRLSELLSQPLKIRPGDLAPRIVKPTDKEYLSHASVALQDMGYLGAPVK